MTGLDMVVCELEHENKLMRARNERIEAEVTVLTEMVRVLSDRVSQQALQALVEENERLGLYEQEPDRFCDAHCSWSEHHPDCKYGKPEQEPVAWMDVDGNISDNNDYKCFPIPLYTTPPQHTWERPWVSLTDDEAQWLYDNCRTPSNLIDMTEAKLKEKNT